MRATEVIYLLTMTFIEDEIGNQIETYTERMVYANEMYVNSSEFYDAAVTGLKPEKQFEIYSWEYEGEKKLKHNNVIYSIIRTQKKGDKIRLICQKVLADG